MRRASLLAARRLWFEAYALPELGCVVHRAVCDDVFDIAGVMDIGQRVAVDQNQVATLAFLDRPQFSFQPHGACRNESCGLYGFYRRESGLDVEFDLAMKAITRH